LQSAKFAYNEKVFRSFDEGKNPSRRNLHLAGQHPY
jgi:hypothetical protein